MSPFRLPALLLAAALLPGCQTLVDTFRIGPEQLAVESASGRVVTLESQADALAGCDVVFLGEVHDSPDGHELQRQLVELLGARRERVVVSLEMFERDVQSDIDAWLAGELCEQGFLKHARPWERYASDYRPVVLWARQRGAPVVAANVPRELARRVAEEGLLAVAGEPSLPLAVPDEVEHGPGEYRERFVETMSRHAGVDEESMERFFAAQCLKDEVMAVAVVEALQAHGPDALVVHLCGSFHSDHGLGTVERLRRRRPDLDIGLVTTRRAPRDPVRLAADDRAAADYVWLVRR